MSTPPEPDHFTDEPRPNDAGLPASGDALDALINRILDGEAPASALGEADAPGEAWRELAMLRNATEELRAAPSAPDQVGAILSEVHARRSFMPAWLRGRVTAARAAVAAGLLVATGLFAMAEREGLGAAVRGDAEPVSRLTASTQADARRAKDAIKDALVVWTRPEIAGATTTLAGHSAGLTTGGSMQGQLELSPRRRIALQSPPAPRSERAGVALLGSGPRHGELRVAVTIRRLSGRPAVIAPASSPWPEGLTTSTWSEPGSATWAPAATPGDTAVAFFGTVSLGQRLTWPAPASAQPTLPSDLPR